MFDPSEIYKRAELLTGKSHAQLRAMAEMAFASMLKKAMEDPGRIIWTVLRYDQNKLDFEVDIPPRRGAAAKIPDRDA